MIRYPYQHVPAIPAGFFFCGRKDENFFFQIFRAKNSQNI